MTKFRAALATLSILTLAGCATEPQVSEAPATAISGPVKLGAGDSIGRSLTRMDRAIAGAQTRNRTLAAHPDE